MKLAQKQNETGTHVMIYGPPKSGKSELAGSMAKEGFKLLWIDIENGWEVLQKLPPEAQDNIEIVTLPDTRTYPIGIETCLKLVTGAKLSVCDLHGKVNCPICKKDGRSVTEVELNTLNPAEWIVVFDSGSQLVNSAISHITKGKDDDYKPDWDDWARLGVLMDKFYSQVQQARWNCIVISHEIEVEMENGAKKLVPIGGTTNFSRNVAKYFGHIVRTDVKNRAHVFGSSTTFAASAITGSRTDVEIEKLGARPSLASFFRKSGANAANASVHASSNSGTAPEVSNANGEVTAGTIEQSGSSSLTALEKFRLAQQAAKKSGT